jgi:hypothetical protein
MSGCGGDKARGEATKGPDKPSRRQPGAATRASAVLHTRFHCKWLHTTVRATKESLGLELQRRSQSPAAVGIHHKMLPARDDDDALYLFLETKNSLPPNPIHPFSRGRLREIAESTCEDAAVTISVVS